MYVNVYYLDSLIMKKVFLQLSWWLASLVPYLSLVNSEEYYVVRKNVELQPSLFTDDNKHLWLEVNKNGKF